MTCSLLFSIGSMVASNVNPWPEVVFMTCRPFAVEEIEQSSHALLLKTNGGYCRSLFQGSLFSWAASPAGAERSEEHTSELQSLAYLVCRLLLEKKKKRPLAILLERKHQKKHTL